MSAEATGWVFRHSPMTGPAFAVHLAIADSVNDQHDHELWMRVPNLAAKARVHPGTCRKALAALIEAGLVAEVDDGRTEGAGSATRPRRFQLLMPDGAADVYRNPRQQREPKPATPRPQREARASGAGSPRPQREARASGAGDLYPKRNPSSNPSTNNPPTPPQQPALLPVAAAAPRRPAAWALAWEEFWSAYPCKKGKAAARRAWDAAMRRGVDPAVVVAGARRYAADPNREPEYTKWPQGWLNDGRWEDDPLPERTSRLGRTRSALRDSHTRRALHTTAAAAFGPPADRVLSLPAASAEVTTA